MRKTISTVFRVLISAALIFLLYWFTLPAFHFRSHGFYQFLIASFAIVIAVNFTGNLISFFRNLSGRRAAAQTQKYTQRFVPTENPVQSLGKPVKILLCCICGLFVVSVIFNVIGAQIFHADAYRDLLSVSDGNFAQDVAELNMSQIPVVDRDTSQTLGKRKLGEMSDLVSQFEIAPDYTQINYNGVPYRVTPLLYGDIIKWFNNRKEGIPGYLTVDMTTQEVSLVRLENGIRYSKSEYFMRNIRRYLRFQYPTKIFDEISFEIDDSGTPYWVASTVEFRIGFWSGRDIGGVVLVNAITGEHEYYSVENAPQWIDQVYSSDLILEQLTYNGEYRSGYWNSLFGQKGVLMPTDGSNYLAIDDDVWLYTGMTSVVSDESNVGFVLVNLRTKETRYYAVPGAEEYSAMSSSEGQVQHLGYTATFPILLNVGDRPTYFMSLKDAAGLVKMYAFVDVQQYQVVATGSTVREARELYLKKLAEEGQVEIKEPEAVMTEVNGTVQSVASAVVDGNTVYYLRLTDGTVLTASIALSDRLPFLAEGDDIHAVLRDGEVSSLEIVFRSASET